MKIHPVVIQQNGIVSVTMQALFVGDPNDDTDKERISAYGDPVVNLAGTFFEPSNPAFSFSFLAPSLYAGLTSQMSSNTARFMVAVPPAAQVGWPTPVQQQLDALTPNPVLAATVWAANIDAQVIAEMALLRALSPAQLISLPDITV